MNVALFCVLEDARVWALLSHWNHSDMHLNYLGPESSFSPSWIPSGCTGLGGVGCWLNDFVYCCHRQVFIHRFVQVLFRLLFTNPTFWLTLKLKQALRCNSLLLSTRQTFPVKLPYSCCLLIPTIPSHSSKVPASPTYPSIFFKPFSVWFWDAHGFCGQWTFPIAMVFLNEVFLT